MDALEAIKERRSIRSYEDREVEQEKLKQVLDAGRLAPSAGNRQEWKFVVVRDKELRGQLVEAASGQQFVGEAPVVIVPCAVDHDHVMSCGHPSFLVDVAIAIDHMTLAARELGLGTCWIGAFDQQKVKDILGIPASVEVVELLPLGYPTSWPGPRPRKSLDEVICYDGWAD
ncbi:MAG: nitroreductase family protein [Candidatus Brocadiae bacterium]|nr:nitroreductase family protein [Candidatus Brocadiia bacterium]